MGALCVRVKYGEIKLERSIGGVPVIFIPGFIYALPIAHPREITSTDGTASVDSNGENPAGLWWWYDKRAKPMDLSNISRDALLSNRMVRERLMARVRTRLDVELGRGYSDGERARMSRMRNPDGTRPDPDEHLLEVFNGIAAKEDRIPLAELPSRVIVDPKGCKSVPLEVDDDGDPIDVPETACRHCGHKFLTRKARKDHYISVHKARNSKAKQSWRKLMDQPSLSATEEPL